MKKHFLISVLSLFFFVGFSQQERKIFGKVTDGRSPMSKVIVSIVNKDGGTISNDKGQYEINAATGDKIQFSYVGMKTITIRVEDVTRVLNPVMVPDVTELDEVVVESSKRRSQADLAQDYEEKETIIRTAYGYLNSETSPGNIRMLTGDEVNTANLCILDMLRTRFPGITVTGNCQTNGAVNIRGGNSITNRSVAIFDVDGQIFEDAPIWLDINNIKRLAIFSNFALTTRYGGIANGGVVVINTINGTLTDKTIVDQARLRNNIYNGKALTQDQVKRNQPTYLKELYVASTLEESKALYQKYATTYNSSPYFYLDAYSHFVEKWDETEFADQIIESNYAIFEGNALLLKALAYIYDEQGRFERSKNIYKEVFVLRPNYAQSYLDMANNYRDLNEPKQAAAIYARYDYLLEEGFMEADSIGFYPLINREFNNLLILNKRAVVGSKRDKLFIAEEDFKGTRIVFEWNDSEAEFDLQFVNPENQYLKWNHSLADNEDTIALEKEYGYNTKEYLIDGSLPGTWQVNVNYFGNKSLTPTYLKATVYSNYGESSQRKEIKVFKLNLKDVNQELFKLNIAGALTSN